MSDKAVASFLGRTANPGNVAIPFTNMVRQVTRDFDDVKRNRDSIKAELMAQVPVVERFNEPALDVLGDPMANRFGDWFTKAEEAGTPEARIYTAFAQHNITPTSIYTYKGKMEPEMYYQFQRERGMALKRLLLQNDARLLRSIEEGSEAKAEAVLENVSRAATNLARRAVGYKPETKSEGK